MRLADACTAGCGDEGGVHRGMRARDLEPASLELGGLERGDACLYRRKHLSWPACAVALVQQAHRFGLERAAQSLEILDLRNCQRGDSGAAVGLELHEALGGELSQSRTHRVS